MIVEQPEPVDVTTVSKRSMHLLVRTMVDPCSDAAILSVSEFATGP
jgi:hypothetical protein